ncbi:TetR/AcrR family transcriptional regulator [Cryptosporangium aurantiacum]|uniref:Transcriptional regulator, TetR family n=1 Tax=Cryptosporangium aurantiacum TaxID=134849 RepID=A0A1M7P7U0_9ACTN|nr:TetR/AcrR family transcriptional regulator [Cryptosporangium aurantiacum]SHN12751.1 transcriptional regulator, TetR family [Cryptosporangium aurantiacum]
MPIQVNHDERRRLIAGALWTLARTKGLGRASLRDVAAEAGMSLGQLQHYFPTREALVDYAIELVSAQTKSRVQEALAALGDDPHPRDVLRVLLVEMFPVDDVSSQVNSARLLDALQADQVRGRVREEMLAVHALVETVLRESVTAGLAPSDLDVPVEAARVVALTGLSPLLEVGVYTREQVIAAIDRHLDELFGPSS